MKSVPLCWRSYGPDYLKRKIVSQWLKDGEGAVEELGKPVQRFVVARPAATCSSPIPVGQIHPPAVTQLRFQPEALLDATTAPHKVVELGGTVISLQEEGEAEWIA